MKVIIVALVNKLVIMILIIIILKVKIMKIVKPVAVVWVKFQLIYKITINKNNHKIYKFLKMIYLLKIILK